MGKRLILIGGEPGAGKSYSLKTLKNPERVLYINTECNKDLPFRGNESYKAKCSHVDHLVDAIRQAEDMPDVDTIIIDTLTSAFDIAETHFIHRAENAQSGWGRFQEYFKTLFLEQVANSTKTIIFLAHIAKKTLDTNTGEYGARVPVKGGLKDKGIEAYFTTVLHCKKVPLTECEPYLEDNNLLNLTPRETRLQYKHVFQTDLSADSVADRIRTPDGMFSDQEFYIDNNLQYVIDRLEAYYG